MDKKERIRSALKRILLEASGDENFKFDEEKIDLLMENAIDGYEWIGNKKVFDDRFRKKNIDQI